jgi:thiol-disulfide isomerase/thioredoxin
MMKSSTRKAAIVVVLAIAGALGGLWTSHYWRNSAPAALAPAPDITLAGLDGKPQTLAQYRGKLLLVNFWATWCAPCLKEMPLLVNAQKQYGAQGLQIIGPALDEAKDVKALAAKLGVNYPVMADFASAEAAMSALGNQQGALPFSVFIDAQGIVIKTVLGGLHEDDLDALIRANLPK